LTDALEIHFVDMVKFRKLGEKDKHGSVRNDALHRWLAYFDPASPGDLVEEVIKMDAGIQKAQERLDFVKNDKEALREYHMREMALSDWTSGVNDARQEGREKGRSEGQKEEKKAIARNLKAMGIPIGQIAQGTGLTAEQIEKL
jgi:predicted transposase/invertase (TIGR01784 family)